MCIHCGSPLGTQNVSGGTNGSGQQIQEPEFVQRQKGNSKWWGVVAALWIVFGVLYVISTFSSGGSGGDPGPKYYVAQIPSEIGNASFNWTGVIDGYIHKDKECCQSVVNYWNSSLTSGSDLEAELVKINPDSTAYKNRMGQAVSYEVALSYCPLCRGW